MRRRAARRQWAKSRSESEREVLAMPEGALRDYLLTLGEEERRAGLILYAGRAITGASQDQILTLVRWLATPQEQS